ncbi:MAG TPA: VWA domain-containing protein [Pyrinomonadaceae bacterium]|nr:VWA domain-containing protein [Pyrinomonadaceae bacterium]
MRLSPSISKCLHVGSIALALTVGGVALHGQDKSQPTKPTADDDVIRVSTTLVQTDAMVFDKQGNFVDGIKPEQFELKVNGQPVPVSFLELVTTGSAEEKTQIEAARRGQPATVLGETPATTITPPAGRSIFLFFDDLHLAAENLQRARKTLINTIDKEITANDRALITAASGQLGSQQLTADKEALKATVMRIAPRAGLNLITERPPMSEYAAVAINRGDAQALDYYVEYELKVNRLMWASKEAAEDGVRSRAQSIIDRSAPAAAATLSSLENLARDLSKVPGRKLLFFLSDGFVIENERSMSYQRLTDVTQQAARSGVVIYALNTRGLVTGMPDASDGTPTDARLSRVVYGADSNSQDVLYSLAADTGGTALVNNNDINIGIRKALDETSKYYLLAWRPTAEISAGEKIKRIELKVAGRPDLKVKTRRFLAEAVLASLTANNAALPQSLIATPSSALLTALRADGPQVTMPTSIVALYRSKARTNFALLTSIQIPTTALSFVDVNGKSMTNLELAGVVLDSTGKEVANFSKSVRVAADSTAVDTGRKLLFYNYEFTSVPPGKYLVRVGARDAKSGLIGSATQTVEIPEISNGKLALSSLMLNEQLEADDEETSTAPTETHVGVAQRFARGSHLQFLTYVYNAKPGSDNEPDVEVDVKILRGNQPLSSPTLRPMEVANKDPQTVPYAAEISLEGLQPGEYVLLVTVTDQVTKATSSQRAMFVVE